MSKRAEIMASRALPNYPPETYADVDEYIEVESERSMQRAFYQKGYEQAIKEVTRKIHKYVATRFIANREKIGLSTYAAGRTEEDKLIMDYIEKLEKEYE